jgi:hypothetical protein
VFLEETDLYSAGDWETFRSAFGLAMSHPEGSLTVIHPQPVSGPNNCNDPGVQRGWELEAIADVEWATAGAPGAGLVVASCADSSTTFGEFIALHNVLNASDPPPALVSISLGGGEVYQGATLNAFINSLFQQAVSEGVSVFVAAGDQGAVDDYQTTPSHGVGVNAVASTPYDVAVGGTDFSDTYSGTNSIYWGRTNAPDYSSALSYIPEIPWNESCASSLIARHNGYGTTYGSDGFCNSIVGGKLMNQAGGGGPSGCALGSPETPGVVSGTCRGYPKPTWQAVFGNPRDGVRDLPDISLPAAGGIGDYWGHGYLLCFSDVGAGGAPCNGDGGLVTGGTSIAAPIMAAIQALVNQRTGERQGNPNVAYYRLAAAQYGPDGNPSCDSSLGNQIDGSCIFHDITEGDIDLSCSGSTDCYTPSGTYGVLSTSDTTFQPAYEATPGWDFATGIGTVNAYSLVVALGGPIATTTTTTTTLPCMTARCLFDGVLDGPACRAEAIPGSVTIKLNRAVALLDTSSSSTARKAKQLRKHAKRLLKLATQAVGKSAKGKKPKLDGDCATSIQRVIDAVRSGIRV